MRIRSSAASIAALLISVGLLAGCTAAAPEADPPAASTPAAEPSPSATPAAAPDLADLCEQLLPLETVQERFGDDTVLLTGKPSARADISGWAGLLRGRIDCNWGSVDADRAGRNVTVTLRRGNTDFFTTLYEQTEGKGGSEIRYDAFGSSLDGCDPLYPYCQYSALVGDTDWLELDLTADQGSALLPPDQIRERWDPEVERMIAGADAVLGSLPIVEPQPIGCETMLSAEAARELTGADDVGPVDVSMFFHDMSLLGVAAATLDDLDRCDWSDAEGGSSIEVLYTDDPDDVRARAFAAVSADSPDRDDAVEGEAIEVVGADEAWRFCFDAEVTSAGCGIDLRVDGFWMQVRTESPDALLPAVERILANLAA